MCGHNAEAAAALQRRGDARLMVHGFVQNMDEIMQAPLSPPRPYRSQYASPYRRGTRVRALPLN